MNQGVKRKLVAGGAVALAAAGSGVAFAARGHDTQPATAVASSSSFASAPAGGGLGHDRGVGRPGLGGGLFAAVESYLGLTDDQLRTDLDSGKTLAQIADATQGKSAQGLIGALVAAEKKELAAAVAAGRLTQAQADQIGANVQQRVTDLVNGTRPVGGPGGRHGPGDELEAASSYLGISVQTILTGVRSGKTLAQVAAATQGKSAAGLIAALVAAEKKELAAAVAAGRLTQAQADQIGASLEQRFTDFVNGTFTKRPGSGFRHGFRSGGASA